MVYSDLHPEQQRVRSQKNLVADGRQSAPLTQRLPDHPRQITTAKPSALESTIPLPAGGLPKASLFHQPWWLSVVTRGRSQEAVVTHEGVVVGRMPYFVRRRRGWLFSEMPPFTRTLGPVISVANGRSRPHPKIVGKLVEQLPRVHVFRQVWHPVITEALTIQTSDFRLGLQYTFRLQCCGGAAQLWKGFRDKTRNVIRRAQERYTVRVVTDPADFVRFYGSNLRQESNREEFDVFPALWESCTERACGHIQAAVDAAGTPVAMVFLAWDDEAMYYILSTRAEGADNGAISLLLWQGMQQAAERGLIFDLDGVSSAGRAQFLSGFGGSLLPRLVVHKVQPLYGIMRAVKDSLISAERANRFD